MRSVYVCYVISYRPNRCQLATWSAILPYWPVNYRKYWLQGSRALYGIPKISPTIVTWIVTRFRPDTGQYSALKTASLLARILTRISREPRRQPSILHILGPSEGLWSWMIRIGLDKTAVSLLQHEIVLLALCTFWGSVSRLWLEYD